MFQSVHHFTVWKVDLLLVFNNVLLSHFHLCIDSESQSKDSGKQPLFHLFNIFLFLQTSTYALENNVL